MDVSIIVPEDVAQRLQAQWDDVPQRALEALALEAYRSGVITEAEVQQMLGLPSRWDVEAFLKRHQAYQNYTEADLEQDISQMRHHDAFLNSYVSEDEGLYDD